MSFYIKCVYKLKAPFWIWVTHYEKCDPHLKDFLPSIHIRFFIIIIEATDWLWAVLVLSWKHEVILRSHIFQEHGGRFINLNTCNEKYNFYFVGDVASILSVSKLPSKEWLQKECDLKNPLLFKVLRIFLEICSKDNIRLEF